MAAERCQNCGQFLDKHRLVHSAFYICPTAVWKARVERRGARRRSVWQKAMRDGDPDRRVRFGRRKDD